MSLLALRLLALHVPQHLELLLGQVLGGGGYVRLAATEARVIFEVVHLPDLLTSVGEELSLDWETSSGRERTQARV